MYISNHTDGILTLYRQLEIREFNWSVQPFLIHISVIKGFHNLKSERMEPGIGFAEWLIDYLA